VDDLWAMKSEDVELIVCAIIFQDFQPVWSWSTNVTEAQTRGQTTCDSKTRFCTALHRTVKIMTQRYTQGHVAPCRSHEQRVHGIWVWRLDCL